MAARLTTFRIAECTMLLRRQEPTAGVRMSKRRTVSDGLPEGVTRQPGSPYLYVYVRSPDGGPTKRFSTRIDCRVLTKAELRAAARRASAAHRLVDGMCGHPVHADVARAVYSGTISITQVLEVGPTRGPEGLQGILQRTPDVPTAIDTEADLLAHLDAFQRFTIGMHLKRRGRPITAPHRRQMVATIRRFLDWAAQFGDKWFFKCLAVPSKPNSCSVNGKFRMTGASVLIKASYGETRTSRCIPVSREFENRNPI